MLTCSGSVRFSAVVSCLAFIGLLAAVAPASSSAGSVDSVRYAWESSAAFERAALPHVPLVPEFATQSGFGTRPGAALDTWSLIRFVKSLPIVTVSLGAEPRLPFQKEPAMGLAFVYRFEKLNFP